MPSDRIAIGMCAWKTIAFCLIAIVMASGGVFVVFMPSFSIIAHPVFTTIFALLLGTTETLLFGCPAFLILRALIKGVSLIELNDDGFSLPAGLPGRQPEQWRWKDVNGIKRDTHMFNSSILVQLTDETHIRRKRNLWQSIDLDFVNAQVRLNFLAIADRSSKEIESLMREYWQAAQSK